MIRQDIRSSFLSFQDIDGWFQDGNILEQGIRGGLTNDLKEASA